MPIGADPCPMGVVLALPYPRTGAPEQELGAPFFTTYVALFICGAPYGFHLFSLLPNRTITRAKRTISIRSIIKTPQSIPPLSNQQGGDPKVGAGTAQIYSLGQILARTLRHEVSFYPSLCQGRG